MIQERESNPVLNIQDKVADAMEPVKFEAVGPYIYIYIYIYYVCVCVCVCLCVCVCVCDIHISLISHTIYVS